MQWLPDVTSAFLFKRQSPAGWHLRDIGLVLIHWKDCNRVNLQQQHAEPKLHLCDPVNHQAEVAPADGSSLGWIPGLPKKFKHPSCKEWLKTIGYTPNILIHVKLHTRIPCNISEQIANQQKTAVCSGLCFKVWFRNQARAIIYYYFLK